MVFHNGDENYKSADGSEKMESTIVEYNYKSNASIRTINDFTV